MIGIIKYFLIRFALKPFVSVLQKTEVALMAVDVKIYEIEKIIEEAGKQDEQICKDLKNLRKNIELSLKVINKILVAAGTITPYHFASLESSANDLEKCIEDTLKDY